MDTVKGEVQLPNGCTLYYDTDPAVGCRRYFSDEVGGGVHVWDTALVDQSTLLAAVVQEERLCRQEFYEKRNARDSSSTD
jgi:hypothetical protein